MIPQEFREYGLTRYAGVTESGLQVFVFPRSGLQTKHALLAVRFGGCDLRFTLRGKWKEVPPGTAHYMEHKMFDMPGYHAAMKLSAAGAGANAFTSSDKTGYHFSCAEGFMQDLEELLTYVSTPYFTEESVAKERGIIAQEIRMREDQPGRRVRTELMKALYARHPIREGNLGTEESIARITPDLLYACHEAFYRPENMVLCCAGDVDPEAVFALASRLLPEKPRRKLPERDRGGEEELAPARVRTETEMSVSMPVFLLGSKLPFAPEGKEWQRRLLLAELSCALFLGESSPLYAALYDEGLANRSFSAGVMDFPGGAVCTAGGRSPGPREALGRIVDAAEAFRTDRETAARFRRLQKAARGNFIMALDSLPGLCHTQADGYFMGFDGMEAPMIRDGLEPEEAEAFIRETFRADRLAVSVVRPMESGKG